MALAEGHIGHMSATTVTLTAKGQLLLPKQICDTDELAASDTFRLERLAPGRYLLERTTPSRPSKPKLIRSKDGFLVFKAVKNAPLITGELVRRLEAEST